MKLRSIKKIPVFVAGYERAISYKAPDSMYTIQGSSLTRKYESDRKKAALLQNCASNDSTDVVTKITGICGGEEVERSIERDRLDAKKRIRLPLHFMSTRTSVKIREKTCAFFESCGSTRTFCTLTFMQDVDHKQAVKILNKFLVALREEFTDILYLWVAEKQTDNGNRIHFHILLNKRLNLFRYNKLWVLQQTNAGLHHPALTTEAWDNWHTHKDAPLHPFDIKKVHTIDGLSQYLTKYVSKTRIGKRHEDMTPEDIELYGFGCRVWHCSRAISEMGTKMLISQDEFNRVDSDENMKVNRETGEIYERKVYQNEYCRMVFIRNKVHFKNLLLAKLVQFNKAVAAGCNDLDKLTECNRITKESYYHQYIYKINPGGWKNWSGIVSYIDEYGIKRTNKIGYVINQAPEV